MLAELGFYQGQTGWTVFNLNTNQSWELYRSLGGYWMDQPLAMDDQGRILMAGGLNVAGGGSPEMMLLLTPDGVTSNPIPAPEPTALVMLSVVSIGFIVRRSSGWRRTFAERHR